MTAMKGGVDRVRSERSNRRCPLHTDLRERKESVSMSC